jgi:hypothetical protein
MEREDDVIDLGSASVETKGPFNGIGDVGIGNLLPGLTDD